VSANACPVAGTEDSCGLVIDKTKNTDELFAYFLEDRARAAARPEGIDRDIGVTAGGEAEWYTLHSVLMLDVMRTIYDTIRVAERMQEIGRAIYPTADID